MVQPNYSPKEALEKMKLLMTYDTKKTLTENKKSFPINEQSSCPNSMDLNEFSDEMSELVDTLRKMDLTFIRMGYVRERAENVFDIIKRFNEKNVLAKTTNECINALVYAKDKFKTFDKSGRIFSNSKTLESTLKELISGYYKNEADALEYLEPSLKLVQNAGNSVTPPPPPTQNERQTNINKVWCSTNKDGIIILPNSAMNGVKWSDYIKTYSVTSSEIDIAKANCPNKTEGGGGSSSGGGGGGGSSSGGGGGSKKSKYTYCPETFPISQNCKNNKIKEIQACLSMPAKYQTGNFGPITQGYLVKAGVSGTEITQDSYDKVCSGKDDSNKLTQDVDDIETLGNNSSVSTTSVASNNTQSSVESGIN